MTLPVRCRACLAADPDLFLPMGDHRPADSFGNVDRGVA
jgi:hypothetical protein